eukprot:1147900-Rhodomonas_salina.1
MWKSPKPELQKALNHKWYPACQGLAMPGLGIRVCGGRCPRWSQGPWNGGAGVPCGVSFGAGGAVDSSQHFDFLLIARDQIELPVQHFDFLLIARDQIELLVQHFDFLLVTRDQIELLVQHFDFLLVARDEIELPVQHFDSLLVAHDQIELPVQHFDFLLIASYQIELLVQHFDFLLVARDQIELPVQHFDFLLVVLFNSAASCFFVQGAATEMLSSSSVTSLSSIMSSTSELLMVQRAC